MKKIEIYKIVKNNILKTLPTLQSNKIKINKNLIDLGANSVDRMDIIINSMEDLNLKIPLLKFNNISNIENIIKILFENLQ